MEMNSKSHKPVYAIVERRTGKKYWVRVGAAFENRDGSLNVQLDALPTNGQLQIREPRPVGRSFPTGSEGEHALSETYLAG